jgi:radical SAM superfamily enzyme YgiQ (UPF0313 family)
MLPESFEKKLIDMNVTPLHDRDIIWADYVFVSAMYIQKNSAKEVIKKCNELKIKVVAGGPLFTSFPDMIPGADHYVLNEAEITLPQFLNDIANNCAKHIYKTSMKADIMTSPVPLWKLVNIKKYGMMGLQFSRGCPFDCDFCDITHLHGHKVRTKTTLQIIKELESIYKSKWRGDVFFVDDNFIGKRSELKNELLPAIINWMNKRNRPFSFSTQASIDLVDDPELMTLMAKAGFDGLFIGLESPNYSSLVECNKKQNIGRDIVTSIKKIQQFGMQVQAGFILGFDNDKPNVFDRLINLIQDSGIVTAMVGLLNAPPGTKLYQKLKNENRLADPPTGDNMDCSINFVPKMNIHELQSGYLKVLNTIYSQKYFCKRVKTFLKNYNFKHKTKYKLTVRDINAFFKSIWQIGMLEKGKIYYWLLLLWSFADLRRLPLVVRYSIFGFHFRKMLKNIQPQINNLQTNAINEFNTISNKNEFLNNK